MAEKDWAGKRREPSPLAWFRRQWRATIRSIWICRAHTNLCRCCGPRERDPTCEWDEISPRTRAVAVAVRLRRRRPRNRRCFRVSLICAKTRDTETWEKITHSQHDSRGAGVLRQSRRRSAMLNMRRAAQPSNVCDSDTRESSREPGKPGCHSTGPRDWRRSAKGGANADCTYCTSAKWNSRHHEYERRKWRLSKSKALSKELTFFTISKLTSL